MTGGRDVGRVGALVGLALSLLTTGCGAKTGLRVPDAGPERDAGVDAGTVVVPVCVEAPVGGGPVLASIGIDASLQIVDVFFLIDATASMEDEIDNVRSGLRSRVVPGVRAAIPEAAFGLAFVGEFPVEPHGGPSVAPYDLRSSITTDVLQVEGALEGAPSWGNFDYPEAQVEGLYQLATGDGFSTFITPSAGCPMGGVGGACFRREAFHVVLLITDAPMHNGPPGVAPIDPYTFEPSPHTYAEALAALDAVDAVVLGLGARDVGSPSPMDHLRQLARDTGAVDGAGQPLVFDIGSAGTGVGSGSVEAIQRLAEGVPLDVDAVLSDVPGDAYDARTLVTAIRPLYAVPADGVGAIEPTRFVDVRPGTEVVFELVVDVSSLPPSTETRLVPARVTFRADGRSRIGERDVIILVPGDDGIDCDDL